MRGEARRAMLADVREILVALLVVGGREHAAVAGEPLRAQDAVTARAVLVPIGGIRTAEAIHRVLDVRKIEVVGGDLDDQDDHVDVVEEAQVDMRDLERDRLGAAREGYAHAGHVATPEDADRRLGDGGAAAPLRLAVEKAPDVRQEGHELAVMPLLELSRRTAELVADLAPRIVGAFACQQVPVRLDLLAFADRHELQRPQQDLPEMADELAAVPMLARHDHLPRGVGRAPIIHRPGPGRHDVHTRD